MERDWASDPLNIKHIQISKLQGEHRESKECSEFPPGHRSEIDCRKFDRHMASSRLDIPLLNIGTFKAIENGIEIHPWRKRSNHENAVIGANGSWKRPDCAFSAT